MSTELLIGLATKAYNKTEDEIKSLILDGDTVKENALQELINLDAARVAKFKAEQTKQHDNGYKKAQAEIASKYESRIKEITGIQDDLIGDELFDAAKSAIEQIKAAQKPDGLTDDVIKAHPLFVNHEREIAKQWQKKLEATKNEFETFKQSVEREKKNHNKLSKVDAMFSQFNPILPTDAKKAEAQRKALYREFDSIDLQEETPGSGNYFVVDHEGKRIEDINGYPIRFEDFVKEKMSYFWEFKQQDAKGSTGNKNDAQNPKTPAKPGSLNMYPKTSLEFSESLYKLQKLGEHGKVKELQANWEAVPK